MPTNTFKDLIVWQKAKSLAVEIYRVTNDFPKNETYGLSSQTQRAAVSISSNIAESHHRRNKKDKDRFISIAYGSGPELESQIEIAKELYPMLKYKKVENLLVETMKILNKFPN